MSEIERIHRYIEKTAIPETLADRHSMRFDEYRALLHSNSACEAISLAFSYGQAKGHRAAKAETRREQAH